MPNSPHHAAPEASRGRIDAFDGLRGIAVAGVLAFHSGATWARGGFLGVSLFFTLSGFLITSLLIAEHRRTGRIDIRAFWRRRANRLLPAAVAALAMVVAYAAIAGGPSQVRSLVGDVGAAAAGVVNWRFVLGGHGYVALWAAPSPVQHYWSLAVEQQLYVVLPLLVAGAMAIGRRRLPIVAAALAAAAVASTAAAVLVAGDATRAYYGTDARAAEVLIGALVGVAVVARPAARLPVPVSAAALVAVIASWSVVTTTTPALPRGGLAVHAVGVGIVLLGVRHPSWLSRVLSIAPLRALGEISYGIYLYHWPIFLWLTAQRTGLYGAPLASARLAVTLAVALLSHRFVEQPFLRGSRSGLPALRWAVPAVTVVVVLAAFVTATAPPPDLLAAIPTSRRVIPPTITHVQVPSTLPMQPSATLPAATPAVAMSPRIPLLGRERPRVYVAGDSMMFGLGLEWQHMSERSGRYAVWNGGAMACHIVRGGAYQWAADPPKQTEPGCNDWEPIRTRQLREIRPHVTVVGFGVFDVLDRRLPDGHWGHIGQPAYDELIRREVDAFARMLDQSGTRTIWLTYPAIRSGVVDHVPPVHDYPESDPARMRRWNSLVRQTVARYPSIRVVDFRGWVRSTLGDERDPKARPDGLHLTPEYVHRMAVWIEPQVDAVLRGEPPPESTKRSSEVAGSLALSQATK